MCGTYPSATPPTSQQYNSTTYTINTHMIQPPNPKTHRIISFIKSGIRILGCMALTIDMTAAAALLVMGELVGIVEELV